MGFHDTPTSKTSMSVAFLSFLLLLVRANNASITVYNDKDLLEFPLNLEFLEAEFFLFGALGRGLDSVAPELTEGGPPPVGGRSAKLGFLVRDIILQFAYQEVGHLRAIRNTVRGFPRPLLNLSKEVFGEVMNNAFGRPLHPPFNPYANDINYLLASYVIPYVGLTGYVGANPLLQNSTSKALVAGLLGVESGQDAVIRTLLYEQRKVLVEPYGVSVVEFTNRISELRNKLGMKGIKDEGLVVPKWLGAEGRIEGNVLAGDKYSLAYARSPEEVLRIVYGTGDEHRPGGFYPLGADGRIAKSYLSIFTVCSNQTIGCSNCTQSRERLTNRYWKKKRGWGVSCPPSCAF